MTSLRARSPWLPIGSASMPEDGSEFLVLHIAEPFPGLHIVHRQDGRWAGRGRRDQYADSFLRAHGLALWAPLSAIPGPHEEAPAGWGRMCDAPRDGSRFLRLSWVHHIGVGVNHYEPDLEWFWRARTSPTSDGYWTNPAVSVADHMAKGGLWTKDALPVCVYRPRNAG